MCAPFAASRNLPDFSHVDFSVSPGRSGRSNQVVTADGVAAVYKNGSTLCSQDGVLVECVVQEDSVDFETIVTSHRDRITRLAHRLLGWSGEAEDVVQDVFLAAFKGLRRFRGDADIGTWLTAITVNKCRTHHRRRWLRLRWLREVPKEAEAASSADQPGMALETSAQVRRAVQALPARYREVVVLRYLEEMPAAEIAALLGISANSVEVRLHRARARLKERLAAVLEA